MAGQSISYIRVSSAEQNLARQRELIGSVDREFIDEASAANHSERIGLNDCIAYLRDEDELLVASIDRLARSLVDLRKIIDRITDKGASVTFLREGMTFKADDNDPRALLLLGILGAFAEFERAVIRERQAEGIAIAKKAGKYKGRKKALTGEQVESIRQRIEEGDRVTELAKEFSVGRSTIYRALKNIVI